MQAPRDDARPYAWAIEFKRSPRAERQVVFVPNTEGPLDQAYVERRAAELHGVIVTLYRERRNS